MTDAMPTTRFIRVDAPLDGHDGVALLTIDRAEARNALSFALLAELADELERLDRDRRTRVAIITGAGDRAFSAGNDLKNTATGTDRSGQPVAEGPVAPEGVERPYGPRRVTFE